MGRVGRDRRNQLTGGFQRREAMAYRIFFSGLVFFVKYNAGGHAAEAVDALLLNPCDVPGHKHTGSDARGHTHEGKDTCPDRHIPQLMVKGVDIAEWRLPGAMHGCGWHHFDLTGRTVFTKKQAPDSDRRITFPDPPLDELSVDPFGD